MVTLLPNASLESCRKEGFCNGVASPCAQSQRFLWRISWCCQALYLLLFAAEGSKLQPRGTIGFHLLVLFCGSMLIVIYHCISSLLWWLYAISVKSTRLTKNELWCNQAKCSDDRAVRCCAVLIVLPSDPALLETWHICASRSRF